MIELGNLSPCDGQCYEVIFPLANPTGLDMERQSGFRFQITNQRLTLD